jgi:DNA-binding GntR family transcriptional regulator
VSSHDIDYVTGSIRAAITSGEFVPGQRLVEAELSDALVATRSVVRAALMDLTHEGLVERIANRGARVRVVSLAEAIEITEVRLAVEGLCAAKAALRVTDDQAANLRGLGAEMIVAVDRGDVLEYSALNQRLHEQVRDLSGQPIAAEILANLRARNVRHQFRLALRPGRPQESLPQHLEIVEAICARDPDRAERAVRVHILSVLATLRATDATSVLAHTAAPSNRRNP